MAHARTRTRTIPALRAATVGVLLASSTEAVGQTRSPLTTGSSGVVEAQDATATANEMKVFQDPTLLVRRMWIDTEWNRYDDGRNRFEETLGGLWAWGVSDDQDWAVRFTLPYEWHLAGDADGDSDDRGLGDLKLATGTAFRLGPSWRTGGGLELRMPTAEDGMGDDVWRIQEFGMVAWDPAPWLTLSPSFEYNQSVAETNGARPQHFLEVFFPTTFLLPQRWSVTARYELKADFENENEVTHSGKLVVGKQLQDVPLGFVLSVKRSFDSGEKEFQLNFVVTYFFR